MKKTMVPVVEKAILNSDLGLNPATAGNAIRVPMPPLTEERRKEMTKVVRAEAEQGRISVRNIRRDANQKLKNDPAISEDEETSVVAILSKKLTDKFIAEIDELLSHKEKDLMEI